MTVILDRALETVDLHLAAALTEQLRFTVGASNEPVAVTHVPAPLEVVGSGTDAVVVRHPDLPDWVYKVFGAGRDDALDAEYEAYLAVMPSEHFPTCIGRGPSYLVISYEAGPTLYDCLEQGIVVPESVLADVEAARAHATSVGLNPRDIHLRNVILQGERAKLLDLAEYTEPGPDDLPWDLFAQAYHQFYPLVRGRAVPKALIEQVKAFYYEDRTASVAELGARALRLL